MGTKHVPVGVRAFARLSQCDEGECDEELELGYSRPGADQIDNLG